MQSASSLGRAIFRIVFRGGSPQRIQYSDRRMVAAIMSFIVLAIANQHFTFDNGALETGLFLFVSLSGLYLAFAWLTRKAPRGRLRTSLLAVLMILAASQLLLLLLAPLTHQVASIRYAAGLAVGVAVALGTISCLQFALAGARTQAATYTLLFAVAIAGLYATLYPLLQIVFA